MTRLVHHQTDRYLRLETLQQEKFEELSERLIKLHTDIVESGEVVRKEESLYEVEIFPGVALCDLIYGAAESHLSRDCLFAFRSMIDQSPILNHQNLADASIIGTIGLIPSRAECELEKKEDWVNFVRLDLTRNEKVVEDFYADFSIAFPRLKFSNKFPGCMNTFDGGHSAYSGIITRCLASLNDNWGDAIGGDLPALLRTFSTQSRCPTTLEGDGDRKAILTFSFPLGSERFESVLCEPHMKLESSDAPGDTEYYYHRIYFCPRGHNSFADKVLVGHAGRHL
ncbi:hypothetical protein [Pseudomonas sp. W2Aug9]|uniref:hypothetical protein n=1 Tax=Pseudomonas sp. W2Aug9 TaxID=1215242 RepID=UPI002006713E|nr:hypothetical protein [Pseudomonas sp. W2Aug9]MCK3828254.1 hypothetical protein [Pseudomonas sp. W2Aug9]